MLLHLVLISVLWPALAAGFPDLADGSVRLGLARRFAPRIMLHPYETSWPADPAIIYERAGPAKWAADSRLDTAELHLDEEWKSGSPPIGRAACSNSTSSNSQPDWPLTFNVQAKDDKLYVQYWMYYVRNGCQGFRATPRSTPVADKQQQQQQQQRPFEFEICPFSEHNGDWEHVTVEADGDGARVLRVGFNSHRNPTLWVPAASLELHRGTHTVVYAARGSHASYPAPGSVQQCDAVFDRYLSNALRFALLKKTELVDGGSLEVDTHMIEAAPPAGVDPRSYVRWDGWDEARHGMHDATPGSSVEWLDFAGRWGQTFDATKRPVRVAPGLPGRYGALFAAVARGAVASGAARGHVKTRVRAPPGPRHHNGFADCDGA